MTPAMPTILLREFCTESISDYVPGRLASTYQDLEDLVFRIFSKDPKQFTVHFHLEDGDCEGKVLPFIWNSGDYVDESVLKAGKLPVFAHFQENPHRRGTMAQRADSRGITSKKSTTRTTNAAHEGSGRATITSGILDSGPVKSRKRSRFQALSPVDDDVEPDSVLLNTGEPWDKSVLPETDFVAPPLPPDITFEKHAADHQVYAAANAPPQVYGHKKNWNDLGKDYHKKIAHARLIRTEEYGIPSPQPCLCCVKHGLECRIYNPRLKALKVSIGASCGECRFFSRTCITTVGKDVPELKRRKVDGVETVEPEPEPEPEPEGPQFFCPVTTCTRASEGFDKIEKMERHVSVKHPRVSIADLQSKDTNKRSGSSNYDFSNGRLICPVQGCPSRSSQHVGYSSFASFQTHCYRRHSGMKVNLLLKDAIAEAEARPTSMPTTQLGHLASVSSFQSIGRASVPTKRASGRVEFYCPVTDCDRSEPFYPFFNLQRHVLSKHPGIVLEDMPLPDSTPARNADRSPAATALTQSKSISKVDGLSSSTKAADPSTRGFACPVKDCSSRSSQGFQRHDNLRRHIRVYHPESKHAVLLTAVAEDESFILETSSSKDQFRADEQHFRTHNAPPGEFGHRAGQQWDKTQQLTRDNIALARAQHKYGVVAPRPCKNCAARRTTCIVYHPSLRLGGPNPKLVCTECRYARKGCDAVFDYPNHRAPNGRPGLSVPEAARSNREIPDSDGPDFKYEDEGGIEQEEEEEEEEEEEVSGLRPADLGSSPSSSGFDDHTVMERGDVAADISSPHYSDYPEFYDEHETEARPLSSRDLLAEYQHAKKDDSKSADDDSTTTRHEIETSNSAPPQSVHGDIDRIGQMKPSASLPPDNHRELASGLATGPPRSPSKRSDEMEQHESLQQQQFQHPTNDRNLAISALAVQPATAPATLVYPSFPGRDEAI